MNAPLTPPFTAEPLWPNWVPGGVYGVGIDEYADAFSIVQHWVQSPPTRARYPSLVWLTDSSEARVRAHMHPLAHLRIPNGLSIVRYRSAPQDIPEPQRRLRYLASLVNRMAIRRPALIAVECPARWLNIDYGHMRFGSLLAPFKHLRRWADASQVSVVLICKAGHKPYAPWPIWQPFLDSFQVLPGAPTDFEYNTPPVRFRQLFPGFRGVIHPRDFVNHIALMLEYAPENGPRISVARLPFLPHITASKAVSIFKEQSLGCAITALNDAAYIAVISNDDESPGLVQTDIDKLFTRPTYELFGGELLAQSRSEVEDTIARIWKEINAGGLYYNPTSQPSEPDLPLIEPLVSEAKANWERRWRSNARHVGPAGLTIKDSAYPADQATNPAHPESSS